MSLKSNFRVLTISADELNVQTAKLGDPSAKVPFTEADIGKPVVMGTQGNFALAASGNFDGFIDSIDGGPTADGMTIGGVARGTLGARFRVYVTGAANVLDYVQADTNTAAGTASATPRVGNVKKSTDPTNFRIVSFESDAASGTNAVAVVERI
jgi:hypothetical protein